MTEISWITALSKQNKDKRHWCIILRDSKTILSLNASANQIAAALWGDQWRVLQRFKSMANILTVLSNKNEVVQVCVWCQHKLRLWP